MHLIPLAVLGPAVAFTSPTVDGREARGEVALLKEYPSLARFQIVH